VGQIPVGVRIALWAVGVATVALLVFLAFWLAAVVVLAWIALKVLRLVGGSDQFRWAPTDPEDRRRHLFYDPLTHNHDPDPRFDDH